MNDSIRLSKTLAHALRHRPELYGVKLDQHGWTSVDHLLVGLRSHGFPNLSFEDIRCLLASQKVGKVRFELSSSATDNERVRICALYGHPVAERVPQIAMEPFSPPHFLFHGTSRETANAIFESKMEIKPMGRQFVHLTEDIETAENVGRRKTKRGEQPVILRIEAENAANLGKVRFFLPKNGDGSTLWLSDSIPAEFVQIVHLK